MFLGQINFENLHLNSFYNESFSDAGDERDPDENLFNKVNTQNFKCTYILPKEIENFLSEKETSKTIIAIHVSIGVCRKTFILNDNLLDIFRDSNYSFKILCVTETWCTGSTLKNNTNLHLPNFDIISQEIKTSKRVGDMLI